MSKKGNAEYLKLEDGFTVITLPRPESVNGEKVEKVRMREPTAGDMETFHDMSGGAAKREIHLFASLCEIAPDDLRKMGMATYKRLQEAFEVFTN